MLPHPYAISRRVGSFIAALSFASDDSSVPPWFALFPPSLRASALAVAFHVKRETCNVKPCCCAFPSGESIMSSRYLFG